MQLLPREVLLPCQILGWLPLKYVGSSGKKVLEFSYAWFFWGLTITLTYSLLSFSALHADFVGRLEGVPVRMKTETRSFTVLVDITSLCTLGIVALVSSTLRYPLFIEMYNSLQIIDEDLQIKSKETKFFKYKIIFFLAFKTILMITTIHFYLDVFPGYIIYVPYWLTHLIQATVMIFTVNIFSVIKERFYLTNEKLRTEVVKQSFGQLLRGVEEFQSNLDFVPGGVTSITKIRTLTEQYWLICEFMRKANKFLSWHLFLSVLSLSIHTIIALFNLFSQIWPTIKHELAPQLVLRSLWVMIHSSELLMILRASTAITDVAHETATTVCKLINRNLSAPLKKHVSLSDLAFESQIAKNPGGMGAKPLANLKGNYIEKCKFEYQQENLRGMGTSRLEVFLLSLRHQNAKFSALGLFQVQSHILAPIAGAVTTYLVILIQFQAQTSQESYGGFSSL